LHGDRERDPSAPKTRATGTRRGSLGLAHADGSRLESTNHTRIVAGGNHGAVGMVTFSRTGFGSGANPRLANGA
jgi:hypothetical protein